MPFWKTLRAVVCQRYRVAHTFGSALSSGFLLALPGWPTPPKETKRSSPDIRPRLRRGSLATSLLRGHAAKGHPWPIAALAASMLLNPLHNDSVRPPEGAIGVCLTYCVGFNGDKLRVIHPNCLLDIGCIAPRLQSSQKLHELFLSIGSQKMRVKWKIENEIITFVITVNSGDSVQKRVTEFV